EVALIDFDCVNPTTRHNGLAHRHAEETSAGAKVGHNLARLQSELGDDFSELEPFDTRRLFKRFTPFFRWAGCKLAASQRRYADHQRTDGDIHQPGLFANHRSSCRKDQ